MKAQTPPVLDTISQWSAPAESAALACRAIFHTVAERNKTAPLDESLKWGQPAWRPHRPPTGSTLRMGWSPNSPNRLSLFVDCKTDLAARMQHLYPDLPDNDGRREIILSLHTALPEQAIAHLADITFAYHLRRTAAASLG